MMRVIRNEFVPFLGDPMTVRNRSIVSAHLSQDVYVRAYMTSEKSLSTITRVHMFTRGNWHSQESMLRVLTSEAQPYGPETRVLVARHYGARALSHGKDVGGGTHMEGSPPLKRETHSPEAHYPSSDQLRTPGSLGFRHTRSNEYMTNARPLRQVG